jgi:glutathione S-transferase
MDWQLSVLNGAMVPLFWNLVRTAPEKRDPATIKTALEKSSTAWEMVENQLARTKYLGGDAFSLGDIPAGVWAYRWFNLPVERPRFDRLSGWYDSLCARPSYQKHVMIPLS